MLASIWLRPGGAHEASLQSLIDSLAGRHGTVRFQPHLTVCGPQLDPTSWDAAADYVEHSRLPVAVRKKGIAYSASKWSRALVIEIEDSPTLRKFREDLRHITGAAELEIPHISLLYTLDSRTLQPMPALDQTRLRAIAEECAPRIETEEFLLGRPIIVAPDTDWANVGSWKALRAL